MYLQFWERVEPRADGDSDNSNLNKENLEGWKGKEEREGDKVVMPIDQKGSAWSGCTTSGTQVSIYLFPMRSQPEAQGG